MGKKLAFMGKIDISSIVHFKTNKHRSFFNNNATTPVACSIISASHLNKKVESHSLPYFCFSCVVQGTGKILLKQNTITLKQGTVFLRFTNEKFSIYRSKDYVEFSIALPPEFGTIIEKYHSKNTYGFKLELTQQLLTSFKYFLNLTRSSSNDNLLNTASKIFKFIIELCDNKGDEEQLTQNIFVEHACKLLKKSLNSSSPGVEIAKKIGMGYETFRKKFKQMMNVSPKQYIMQLKFEKAAEMILSSYSIKETAFELGYSEIPAFSRQFKKYYGISPAKYKQKSKFEYL